MYALPFEKTDIDSAPSSNSQPLKSANSAERDPNRSCLISNPDSSDPYTTMTSKYHVPGVIAVTSRFAASSYANISHAYVLFETFGLYAPNTLASSIAPRCNTNRSSTPYADGTVAHAPSVVVVVARSGASPSSASRNEISKSCGSHVTSKRKSAYEPSRMASPMYFVVSPSTRSTTALSSGAASVVAVFSCKDIRNRQSFVSRHLAAVRTQQRRESDEENFYRHRRRSRDASRARVGVWRGEVVDSRSEVCAKTHASLFTHTCTCQRSNGDPADDATRRRSSRARR